jgi:hypothetical protein
MIFFARNWLVTSWNPLFAEKFYHHHHMYFPTTLASSKCLRTISLLKTEHDAIVLSGQVVAGSLHGGQPIV